VFAQWQAASRNFFTFTQVPTNGNIQLAFGGTALDSRFGNPGGVAASAGYPPSGRVVFDSADFPVSLLQGNNIIPRLQAVALHEIGHALGLTHSSSPSSLMYPFNISATAIDAETANAIHSLYNWTPLCRFPDSRSSSDGQTFATTSSLNFTSAFNSLAMAWRGRGNDSNIWFSSTTDLLSWTPQVPLDNVRSTHGPALAALGDRLFMFWKGSGNDTRIFYATLPAGPLGIWSAGEEVSYVRAEVGGITREIVNTDSHSAAVQRGTTLVLTFRGQPGDSAVWFMVFSNGEWSAPLTVPGAGTYTGPGAGTLNNTLLVAWKALDPDYELHLSTLG
jgi:hypothetical protein